MLKTHPFLGIVEENGHIRRLDQIRDEIIDIALLHYGGRQGKVARHLGIGRTTLYKYLKERDARRL